MLVRTALCPMQAYAALCRTGIETHPTITPAATPGGIGPSAVWLPRPLLLSRSVTTTTEHHDHLAPELLKHETHTSRPTIS